MFAEKSDKLLQNFSFKTEIKTESNKLKQGQKDIELGTTKWSFCTLKQIRNYKIADSLCLLNLNIIC